MNRNACNISILALLMCLYVFLFAFSSTMLANASSKAENGDKVRITNETITVNLGDNGKDIIVSIETRYELYNPGEEFEAPLCFAMEMPCCFWWTNDDEEADKATKKFMDTMNFKATINGEDVQCKYEEIMMSSIGKNSKAILYNKNLWEVDTEAVQLDNWKSLVKSKERVMRDSTCAGYVLDVKMAKGKNVVTCRYGYAAELVAARGEYYSVGNDMVLFAQYIDNRAEDCTFVVKTYDTFKAFYLCFNDIGSVIKIRGYDVVGNGKVVELEDAFTYKEVEPQRKEEAEYIEWYCALRNGEIRFHLDNFNDMTKGCGICYSHNVGKIRLIDDSEIELYDCTLPGCDWVPNREYLDISDEAFEEYVSILRSLPYVARGYVFKNKKLADNISKIWWYMPDETFDGGEDGLSKGDKRWLKEFDEEIKRENKKTRKHSL